MAVRLFRETPSEFELAKARWGTASAKRRELRARLDGAEAALSLALNPPSAGDVTSPLILERARAYSNGRSVSADRLAREIAALEDEVADAGTAYAGERQIWADAVETESRRLADLLRPGHQAAVQRIAKAVEALSAAIEGERAIRAELGELGGSLPDAGHEFGVLSEYHSLLSQWNRRILAAGFGS